MKRDKLSILYVTWWYGWGEIHKANQGIPTAVIGVCARYIHSTDAVFDIRDYFSARQLLMEAVINLDRHQINELQYEI